MKVSKKILVFVLIAMLLTMVGCSNESKEISQQTTDNNTTEAKPEEKVYKLKLGYNTNENSIRGAASKRFKEIVEKESNGRIQIEIFPAEGLGSEQEQLEAVQVGAQDLQLAGGGSMSNIIPEFSIMSLPFLVNNFDEAYAVLDGPIGDGWKKIAEQHGYKILSYCDLGFAQVTNNVRPINAVDDLKGVKMRSPNEPSLINTFKALGASVSTMPFTEVYLGLSQGVVDGQFNPLDAIYETKFHEVQDYLAMTNVFYYHINFIMNKNIWDSLDPELQDIIQKASYEARDVSREYAQEKQNTMLEQLKSEFKEITYPDTKPFREKVVSVYDEFKKKVDGVDETIKFIEEYRSKNK